MIISVITAICLKSNLTTPLFHYITHWAIPLNKSLNPIWEEKIKKGNILLVTETPPGTPNGFGVTLNCMFRDINHQVLYTDTAFKEYGDSFGYLLAQVPYHRSSRFLPSFLMGMTPEWRGLYSSSWIKKHLSEKFSSDAICGEFFQDCWASSWQVLATFLVLAT